MKMVRWHLYIARELQPMRFLFSYSTEAKAQAAAERWRARGRTTRVDRVESEAAYVREFSIWQQRHRN